MNRSFIIITSLCFAFLLSFANEGFTQDREVTSRDLKGVPRSHKYFWSVLGGTAAGAGIGLIASGGAKSAFKGVMLGGSVTSAFYLAKNPKAGGDARPFAEIFTYATLGSGLGWTVCNCGTGGWAGGLLGGGGTALFQAMGSHNSTVATLTTPSSPPQGVPVAAPNSQSKTADHAVLDDQKSQNEDAPPELLDTPHEQEK